MLQLLLSLLLSPLAVYASCTMARIRRLAPRLIPQPHLLGALGTDCSLSIGCCVPMATTFCQVYSQVCRSTTDTNPCVVSFAPAARVRRLLLCETPRRTQIRACPRQIRPILTAPYKFFLFARSRLRIRTGSRAIQSHPHQHLLQSSVLLVSYVTLMGDLLRCVWFQARQRRHRRRQLQ
jgi:hypothetical protein